MRSQTRHCQAVVMLGGVVAPNKRSTTPRRGTPPASLDYRNIYSSALHAGKLVVDRTCCFEHGGFAIQQIDVKTEIAGPVRTRRQFLKPSGKARDWKPEGAVIIYQYRREFPLHVNLASLIPRKARDERTFPGKPLVVEAPLRGGRGGGVDQPVEHVIVVNVDLRRAP